MLGYDVALINQSDTEENAKVSVCQSAHDFRSSPGSGHRHGRSACLKSATSGLLRRSEDALSFDHLIGELLEV
jgi:hypothetical protein